MGQFSLQKFQNGQLVDDFAASPCDVLVRLVGDARYEILAECEFGRTVSVALWTTRKGKIITRVSRAGEVAPWGNTEQDVDGTLHQLVATECSLHLEHMDRGHYWLGLDHEDGSAMHVNFSTPGYLKTKVLFDKVHELQSNNMVEDDSP